MVPIKTSGEQKSYMLNELIWAKVTLHGKKTGRLADIVIKENGKLPIVSHFFVSRPFGSPSLLIPWENIISISTDEIVIKAENLQNFEKEPDQTQIRLKDQVLDKKILDTEDREVDVVYDIRLILLENKLYVSDVDTSRTGLLRRVHLGKIANLIENRFGKDNRKLIHWKYLQQLPTQLGRFTGDVKLNILKEKLADIHHADLADILDELDYKQRTSIFAQLDVDKASLVLAGTSSRAKRELMASLKKEKIIELFEHLTSGQIAEIISVLPYNDIRTILQLLDEKNAKKVKSIISRQETDILNYATSKFISIHPFRVIGDLRLQYYQLAEDKKIVMYLYVVDENDRLIGVLDIKDILLAKENKLVKDVMITEVIHLTPKSTLRDALGLFERYDFRALPIINKDEKIMGVVSYGDVKILKHKLLE